MENKLFNIFEIIKGFGIIQQNEIIIKKQFEQNKDDFQMLIESSRKFVKNYNIGNLGFVTCFMDSDLKIIHGIALVKQSDMKVFICSFLNNKRHGHCLTF